MDNINDTIIFIFNDIRTGGIAINVVKMIDELKKLNKRIIWMHRPQFVIDDELKKDFINDYIEEIDCTEAGLIDKKKLKFNSSETVTIWTVSFADFIVSEIIKRNYKRNKIDTILWVQHYKGFFEEAFKKPLDNVMYHLCRKAHMKMDKNDNIFYLSNTHLRGYENHYRYKAINTENKISHTKGGQQFIFDEPAAVTRYRLPYFNVIAVGRYDFPHKGFIIGLIKAYSKLKAKYPQLHLTIIGYGKDEDKVIDEINKLTVTQKSDITLVGKVDFRELPLYFANAHLNVGLAATVRDGAKQGVISLPVRHYSYSCDTYGFLPESKVKTLTEEPGEKIEIYIEKVIKMSEQEFIKMSRTSCESYVENSNTRLDSFRLHNTTNRSSLSLLLILGFKFYKRLGSRKMIKTKEVF